MAKDAGREEMEKDFEARLRLQQRSNGSGAAIQKLGSMSFRAPQEHFTIQDFQLGKIYGAGSYSKVRASSLRFSRSRGFFSLDMLRRVFYPKLSMMKFSMPRGKCAAREMRQRLKSILLERNYNDVLFL